MIWYFLTVVGVANIYIGRLIALWGLPADFVGKRSPALTFLAGTIDVCAVLFLLSDQQSQYFSFNIFHAFFLSGCVFVSHMYFSRMYRPRNSWDKYFNDQIQTLLAVLKRQSFCSGERPTDDPNALPGGFHFDEQDFRTLIAIPRMDYYAARPAWLNLLRLGEPIDFDRVSAEEIIRLAMTIPRQMQELATREPLDHVDKGGLRQVAKFAEALKKQWGQ